MEFRATSLRATIRELGRFLSFVARKFLLFHLIMTLTVVVLALEYAATSLMIPLSSSAPGARPQGAGQSAVNFWLAVADRFHQLPGPKTWLLLFFLVMIARTVFGYLQNVSTTLLGKKVHKLLSDRIFGHVVSAEPLKSIYTRSVGHYITLAGDDTFRCGTIISSIIQCGVSLCSAGVALVVLDQFSTTYFWAVVAFLSLSSITISLLFRYILRVNARATKLSRDLNTVFVEALNNLRSIRAFHAEQFVRAGYARQIALYVRMLFEIDAMRAAIKAFPAVVLLIIAALLMRDGSSLTVSEATLLGVTIIVIKVFASMGQFITSGSLLLTDMRAVGDIAALIANAQEPVLHDRPPAFEAIESIELNGVDFGYGGRHRVLDNFSARFERGSSYAIVGPSGSGKSTLADVMLGLTQPDGGSVTINSGRLPLSAVRGRLLLVEQQPKIFSTTLRENLLLGADATDERLWEALRLVELEQFVKDMRNGLETVLSYQGENFSGGQRQRIGIARAIVRSPDVLILDEATSALDISTRHIVLNNVRQSMRSGILLQITHDLQQAERADFVLDFGRLDEKRGIRQLTGAAN
jgi:ATP-binding cassette subfamily B protein